MLRLPAISHYTFLFALVACLFLPTVGLTAEDTTVAGLRARVKILDQARNKAAAELSAKEQQGGAGSRDREHFRTVAESLDQRIAESCSRLVEKGGTAAAADLPCPNPVAQEETGQETTEEKSRVEESGAQATAKQQKKVVEPEEKKEASPVSVPPAVPPSLEAVPVREKVEAPQALPQQPPATGFFEGIRRWLESLFAPKPPPATSGSKSGKPAQQTAEQAEKTKAEQQNTKNPGDSASQQTDQNSTEGNKGAAATTGNRKQTETSAAEEKVVSKEKGSGTTEQKGMQGGSREVANGKAGAGQADQTSTEANKGTAATTYNREQSDNSAGEENVASKEKGAGQEQEQQQQENGVKQAAADGEESGHPSGNEQAGENGAKGAEAAGGKDSKSEETSVTAGSGTTKQKGMQAGSREAANGKAGAGQKSAGQEENTGNGQQARQGASLSRADERKTADVGPSGKGKETGQKKGTGQQVPAQSAGQPMTETANRQTGPVGSGPGGEKKTTQSQKQDSGASPVSDAEVAKLEQLLSDALGEFDGKLLSEQERLAARIPKQREGSAGGSGGYGAEGPVGPGGSGGIAGGGYESSGGQQGDGRAGAGGHGQPGSVATGSGNPAPAGGRTTIDTDDDIVARQLREAAENETDPELKEKLWQEYRKYKQGGG